DDGGIFPPLHAGRPRRPDDLHQPSDQSGDARGHAATAAQPVLPVYSKHAAKGLCRIRIQGGNAMTIDISRRGFLSATALLSASTLLGRSAFAQDYPSKKIDYI